MYSHLLPDLQSVRMLFSIEQWWQMALSFILWNVKYKEQLEQVSLCAHFLQIKYGAKPLLFMKNIFEHN